MDELTIFKKKLDLADLETEFLKLPDEMQVETPLVHHFADGVYVRELLIPKGTIIIGKRHRFETCNILLQGKISLYMGENIPVKTLKAPAIFNSKPGTKKMGFTHEDTIFLNIHPTSEKDLDKIEEEFIIPEEEFVIEIERGEKQCLGQP